SILEKAIIMRHDPNVTDEDIHYAQRIVLTPLIASLHRLGLSRVLSKQELTIYEVPISTDAAPLRASSSVSDDWTVDETTIVPPTPAPIPLYRRMGGA